MSLQIQDEISLSYSNSIIQTRLQYSYVHGNLKLTFLSHFVLYRHANKVDNPSIVGDSDISLFVDYVNIDV